MTVNQTVEMPYEELLRYIVRHSEERYIWYKKQLELIHKDKETWPPNDEFTAWYKDWNRELKNREEAWLKLNREELEYYRQGMNPPFYYPY